MVFRPKSSCCLPDASKTVSLRGSWIGQFKHPRHPPSLPFRRRRRNPAAQPVRCGPHKPLAAAPWRTFPAFLRSSMYRRHPPPPPSSPIFCAASTAPAGNPAENIPRHSGRNRIFCIPVFLRTVPDSRAWHRCTADSERGCHGAWLPHSSHQQEREVHRGGAAVGPGLGSAWHRDLQPAGGIAGLDVRP